VLAICALVMLRVVGLGGWARACSGWWGFARGGPKGGSACRK
jgi:hypothetical protein